MHSTPQRSPVAATEAAVCLRLREARLRLGLDQEEVAKRVGMKADTLSMLERCKAPVRFDVGLRICRELVLSEEWLATGEFQALDVSAGRRGFGKESSVGLQDIFFRQCLDLWSEPVTRTIPPRTLLTVAFADYLKDRNAVLALEHFYEPRLVPNEHDGLDLRLTVMRAIIDRSLLVLGSEALRLGQSQEVARLTQHTYLRGILETSEVLFRRFLGHSTPQVREPRFDFLRAIVKYEDLPIGPLVEFIERDRAKKAEKPSGAAKTMRKTPPS